MRKQLLTVAAATGILFSGIHGTASANGEIYAVKQGDTLWNIATLNGLTLTELKSLNGLTSDIIYPGQSLVVKESPTFPSPTTTSINTYTVKSGDSLWMIASRYHLTVSQLKAYNLLSSDNIYVGQVLKLTSDGVQASVSKVSVLIAEAKKYMGVPYKWGGSTPTAFDCSGYLNYVYNHVGISIPRTVATIWNTTKSVSSPNIGDLVFFNTNGSGPSHVGIYLGNNQFIHAGTSTGVTISDMNQLYWKTKYVGARTPF